MAVKFNLPIQDPRSYVKQIPLPVKSQVAVKIQARTDTVYNPTDPTRDEVRRENYARRQHQLTQEGFQSPIWKPYHGIGDPVYLDDRALILDTLGLIEKEKKREESGDETEEAASTRTNPRQQGTTVNPSKYMQRRMRRGLVNLKAELRHSENIGHYVRIGQSFFDILHKEKDQKLERERMAIFKEKERLRTEIQPPKYESSSEEEYDDFGTDMTQPAEGDSQSRPSSAVISTMSTFVRRKRRKINPRPYTPLHCNIGLPTNTAPKCESSSGEAIFRQLCCLHWFLEAMNTEPPNVMKRISSSWEIRQIGGGRQTQKAREAMRDVNQGWDRFVTPQRTKSVMGKRSSFTAAARKAGFTSTRTFLHRSNTSGSVTASRASSPTPPAEDDPSAADEDEKASNTARGMPSGIRSSRLRPLSSRSEASTRPSTGSARRQDSEFDLTRSDAQSVVSTASSRHRSKPTCATDVRGLSKAQQQYAIPLDIDVSKLSRKKISELSRMVGAELDRQTDFYADRKEFRSMKLGGNQTARPYSAPVTTDLRQFPSQKWLSMVQDMRIKFDLVAEEKAIDLQDRLDHMERHRLKACTDKFLGLPTKGAPHRAIAEMRARGRYDTSASDSNKRRGSMHSAWYTELLKNVPAKLQSIWFMRAILSKLQVYAVAYPCNARAKEMQSSKLRVLKFTKVLQTLTDWEICCPDVSAAIEFVREKVVDMTVEEFEEWFQESFPHVERPVLPAIRISTLVEPPPELEPPALLAALETEKTS